MDYVDKVEDAKKIEINKKEDEEKQAEKINAIKLKIPKKSTFLHTNNCIKYPASF